MNLTPIRLGDGLARLVWESFTDFIEMAPVTAPTDPDQRPTPDLVPEELLILFLWVHTRACQQALAGRVEPETVRETLDELHRAIFEDMEAHGVAREALPLFEQRVSARYSEYYTAADGDERFIGEIAARRVSGRHSVDPAFNASLAEAILATAGPLRDFLDEVTVSA